jgi:hypothetical protein
MKTKLFILLILLISVSEIQAQSNPVRRSPKGMLIIGRGDTLRAVEPFKGLSERGIAYAEAVNRYKDLLGDSVRVYCMVIPTAVAFYCPTEGLQWTSDEREALANIEGHLADSVIFVNLYDTLKAHSSEPIYSRTDHHWAPLGAYYAAREFAAVAEVPFEDLSTYKADTIRHYVGTMMKFSGDNAVGRAPEDFVFYIPNGVEYATTYIRYQTGKSRQVISETEPEEGPFFFPYNDGSSSAYLTFMKGDLNTTMVKTSTTNGRRLLILKDSFGNALPGYLFHSFEEVHVVDCRYFTKNIRRYATDNHITDVLFANNIGHAHAPATANSYHKYLEQ